MSRSNELRVFISSTFRDLQEEREHLVKKIFPEIRSRCRERGITFTEVDLRWGLTDEDVALGRVIRTCLEEVDKCRPYFIGITGSRYGYVPTQLDIYKDPLLLQLYPWIEEAAIDEMSITEMEAQYAVLNPATSPSDAFAGEAAREGGSALFYFRRDRTSPEADHDEDDEGQRLKAYQQRIRSSGASIEEFGDVQALGDLIRSGLQRIIERDYGDARPPTPLEEERARHEAFAQSRRRAYIPNPAYVKQLNAYVSSEDPPLVVYAESGSGKSSLFAYWAEQYRKRNPDAHIIEHYVGIGATSTDHYAIIRHICMEIKERFSREEEIPSEPSKLETALGQWLGYADHALRSSSESSPLHRPPSAFIVILDGLNQLQGAALNLKWIPDVISPSIRLILSSTVEGTLVELRKRGWSQFGMQALSEAERETIVVRYLAEYRKSLSAEQIKRMATDYKCGHPLFLKTVLEELRLVGRHEELDEKIASYLAATGTEDLFQRVLERLEEDYDLQAVREVMVLLSTSRSGLDERELSEMGGLARLKIATMVAGLDYHLVRKEGRLTFFHDYLRRAVEKRYLSDGGKRHSVHHQIAEYFEREVSASIAASGLVASRMAGELAYQLHAAGSKERLAESLSTIPVFMSLFQGEGLYEVLGYWSSMGESDDVESIYRSGVERWEMEDAGERSIGLGLVADLLQRLGRWSGAIELERERRSSAIERGDRSQEAASRLNLGWLLYLRGEHAEAFDEGERAREIYMELGDRSGISRVIGNMGIVYTSRGEYDRALEMHRQQLSISEALGDRSSVSRAIGNMGIVYYSRGEYDRALESYQRQLSIAEALGDRSGVCTMIGNMGVVYTSRGEYDRALESYQRQLRMCEELGDRRGVSRAVGNMGIVHSSRREYDRALESFQQQLSITEEVGDPQGVAIAIGNMGKVYHRLGEYDRALECYQRKLHIMDGSGNSLDLFITIGNIGNVHSSRGEYEPALESFHRAVEGHRAIDFRYGLTYWLEGIGQVLANLAQSGGSLPEYLPRYLPDVTEDRWHAMALQQARACAVECIAISDEISKPDTQFSGRILLARMEAAEGCKDVAVQRLTSMMEEATEDEQRAELHYWLWKHGVPGHASAALSLYQSVFPRIPAHDYRERIDELKAAGEQP